MEFTVTVAGMAPFHFAPVEGGDPRPARPCRPGEQCDRARQNGRCCVTEAAAPVLDAFSLVLSHEPTRVACREGGQWTFFEETGQRAALRLLISSLTHSACPFFQRFSALPDNAPLPRAYAAFARLARSLVRGDDQPLARSLVRGDDQPLAGDVREAAPLLLQTESVLEEIEAHLRPLLREARRRCRQDAAINAVILMFSGTRLATEHLQEAGSGLAGWALAAPGKGTAALAGGM